jgi:hypothetical protein
MPSNTHLAIPSFKRPDCLLEKTVRYLNTTDWQPTSQTVFVADMDEFHAYRPLLGTDWSVQIGGPTLRDQRQAIQCYYPVGDRVVCMDDDIDTLVIRMTKRKLQPLVALDDLVGLAFPLAAGGLWGIYPVANSLFMQPRVVRGLVYLVGCFYGFTVEKTMPVTTLEDKEDFERTLQYFARDRFVTRLEWVAPKTNYYTQPGGMQETRTRVRVFDSAMDLARRYPQWCVLSEKEKSGWIELRLTDRTGLTTRSP